MSSHFIHINLKKNHDRYYKKILESNNTVDDKTKTKSKSITLANNSKRQISKINYSLNQIKSYAYKKFIMNYNTLPKQYNLNQIDNFIKGKYCHTLASFKEKILFNYSEEFLKKNYKIIEIKKKIPLFYEFYKSYLQFFGSPTLSDLNFNDLRAKAIEKKAKAFYNQNYKDESSKKEKKMNIVIFTSKIRRDLSRETDLTNLSKTTIMERNVTNKNSVTSANSIARIFNEIGNSNKDNNNEISKNKSFINKNNNINNNSKNNKLGDKNKNVLNKENKGNSNNNIKKTGKFRINKKRINELKTSNINLNTKIKINFNSTNIDSQYKKIISKKTPAHLIQIINTDKRIKPPSLSSGIRSYGNKTHRELKGTSKFNIINNGLKNSNLLFNKSGNTTITNISNFNKKNIKKPISRNYIINYMDKKNTFPHLKGNIINKFNSSGKNIKNNNNTFSLNSFNRENYYKTSQVKILKSNINKKIINKNNITDHEYNTFNTILNLNDKNRKIHKNNEINSNNAKNRLNINKYYTKISLYKKPGSLSKNSNILKELNSNRGPLNKVNNNSKKTNVVSNVKTTWNKLDNKYKLFQRKKNKGNSKK